MTLANAIHEPSENGAVTSAEAIPPELAKHLVTPAAYADDRILDAYRWLRANNPLGKAYADNFDPFWVVTRYADVQAISRQNDIFRNETRAAVLASQVQVSNARAITGTDNLIRTLVHMDAPDHPKYRLLTQSWFSPANLRKFEDRIRVTARSAVDRMIATGGRCDFVTDVALRYPLHVIMHILGVPETDEPRMLKLTQELFGPEDPDTARFKEKLSPQQLADMIVAIVNDFGAYFNAITEDRRLSPRDDLASVIANGTIDGAHLPPRDITSYFMIVATAGHDTTSSSTAGAMWALAREPDLLARVKTDPSLIGALIDEAIRFTTPVKHFMRGATQDVTIGARDIKKGDWLMLCYASANRDEAVFADPDTFSIDRGPNRHLAFGYGAHLCLGQYLAKMEMRMLFEELLPRISTVSLDGEAKLSQSCFVSGLKSLPIRFTTA